MSMPDDWIQVDHVRFSLEEIKSGNIPDSLDAYYQEALRFCRDWLNGKEHFQLTTSGSTGTPKKIDLTRNQLIASARLSAAVLGLQKGFTALVCLDIRYIAGLMMMVRSLEVGMHMIITSPSSNPLEKIDECTIDFTALVPLQLDMLLASPQIDKLNKIKIVLIGGAPVTRKTIQAIKPMSCCFYLTYGMTETLTHVALKKLNGSGAQEYFEALPGITLRMDERGCLVIHAPHLGENPVITNDLIEFKSPTQFCWLGRADTIINTGGIKVIPENIEAALDLILNEMGIATRFFVAGLPDEKLGESVNLFIEGLRFSEQMEAVIQHKLKETLTRYECPKSIQYVSGFINTDTGKVNKVKTLASLRG